MHRLAMCVTKGERTDYVTVAGTFVIGIGIDPELC